MRHFNTLMIVTLAMLIVAPSVHAQSRAETSEQPIGADAVALNTAHFRAAARFCERVYANYSAARALTPSDEGSRTVLEAALAYNPERVARRLAEPHAPDLSTLLPEGPPRSQPAPRASELSPYAGGGVAPTAPMNFTEILLRGLAQFLATRARLEVQQTMVSTVRSELCADNTPQRDLLRSTCALLGNNDHSRMFGLAPGRAFVTALVQDAARLPQSLATMHDACRLTGFSNDGRAPCTKTGTLAEINFRLVLELIATLSETTDLATVAGAMRRVSDAWSCLSSETTCVQQLDKVRKVLRVVSESTAVPIRDLGAMSVYAMLYRAELLRDGVATGNNASTGTTNVSSIPSLVPLVNMFVSHVNEVNAQLAIANNAASDRATRDEARKAAARALLGAINMALAFPGALESSQRIDLHVPTSALDLVAAIATGSTSDVLVAGLRTISSLTSALGTRGISVDAGVLRVLAFGADLAAATTPDEAAVAMDNFLAPLGSWRVKSVRGFHGTLNGYVGFAGGLEFAANAPRARRFGLLGAVGPEFTLGFEKWNLGLFVPVLDIGALLPYSSNNGDTPGAAGAPSQSRTFDPLRFLTPGVFLRVGCAGAPVVIGAGWYYQFAAHQLTQTGAMGAANTTRSESAHVLQLFVAIDIPMWVF